MTFLFSGIFDVLSTICKGIMYVMGSGDLWKSIMIETPADGTWNFTATKAAAFDHYIPGIKYLKSSFIAIGIGFTILFLYVGLARALAPDTPNSKASHPAVVIGRTAVAGFAVTFAYQIVSLIQIPMAVICTEVNELAQGKDAGMRYGPAMTNGEQSGIMKYLPDNLFSPAALTGSRAIENTPSLGDLTGAFQIVPAAISCILLLIMTFEFMKLILEMVERYVVCGFLFYLSPLAFSMLGSEGTSSAAKSYLEMLISQYMVIIFNYLVIFIFYYSIGMTNDVKAGGESLFFLCLLIAWLRLGTKLDEMFRTLGFSVAQTGAGLGAEIMGAAGAIGGMAAMGLRAGQGIRSAATDSRAKRIEATQKADTTAPAPAPGKEGARHRDGTPLTAAEKANVKSADGKNLSRATMDIMDPEKNPMGVTGPRANASAAELWGREVAETASGDHGIKMNANGNALINSPTPDGGTAVSQIVDKTSPEGQAIINSGAAYVPLGDQSIATVTPKNSESEFTKVASGQRALENDLKAREGFCAMKDLGGGKIRAEFKDQKGNHYYESYISKNIHPNTLSNYSSIKVGKTEWYKKKGKLDE